MTLLFTILFFISFGGLLFLVAMRLKNRQEDRPENRLYTQLLPVGIGASAVFFTLTVVFAITTGTTGVPKREHDTLVQQHEALQAQMEELSAKAAELELQLRQKQAALEDAESQRTTAEARLEALQTEVDVLAESLITLNGELDVQRTRAEEAQAAASQAQQQAEEAQSRREEGDDWMAWISLRGKEYHLDAGCKDAKNPVPVLLEYAIERGYKPCDRCT